MVSDVCLLLEGTYPYVRGGVSAWVHGLITGLPELTFSLLLVSAERDHGLSPAYELPPNVNAFAEVFIHDAVVERARAPSGQDSAWASVGKFHRCPRDARSHLVAPLLKAFGDGALSVEEALFSSEAWQMVLERYKANAPGTSFIDYFWTWRAVHAPLMQTLIAEIPEASVYHPISTGYAGLLGALATLRHDRPMLLTEHGIYVRERAIDVARAEWIYEEPVRVRLARPGTNPLKEMWINFFVTLGQITYQHADQIITLFGGNQALQHQLGADPKKTRVIPNGVVVDRFAKMRALRRSDRPLRVGLVGRVVPIKDVKTFLRACALVAQERPEVEYWLAGPTEEDQSYYDECEALRQTLGLEQFRFLGMQNVRDIYPNIDVMALTSISEGQPLTILEAACAGVPSVVSDVGACRELIEGRTAEDVELGPGGIVTGVGDPEETAKAILDVLGDADRRAAMARAGIERTERFYRQSDVIERYRAAYGQYL